MPFSPSTQHHQQQQRQRQLSAPARHLSRRSAHDVWTSPAREEVDEAQQTPDETRDETREGLRSPSASPSRSPSCLAPVPPACASRTPAPALTFTSCELIPSYDHCCCCFPCAAN